MSKYKINLMSWILSHPRDYGLMICPVNVSCTPVPWSWVKRNWNSRFMKKMIFRKCHYNVIYSGGHVVTYSCGNTKSKIAFPFACIWSLFLFFSLLSNLEVEPSNYIHVPAPAQHFLSSKCTWYILVRTVGETSGLLGIKWNPMGD